MQACDQLLERGAVVDIQRHRGKAGGFQGGDQGFNLLFEELVQYVNSLATSYAFTDELNTGGRSSQKDGLLTFLWYLERYLYMARNDYPSAYAHILSGDGGCWRDLILQVWGRASLYLGITEDMPHLGIDDAALLSLVETPELLAEIQRVRDAAGCVMANRLSENPKNKVLLLEFGGRDNSVYIRMPIAFSIPLNKPRFDWGLHTEPEPGLNGRSLHQARGKVIGGSSSINGMAFVRGNAGDFGAISARNFN